MKSQINSLRNLIYGILNNEKMTVRELVNCLMSEPYKIKPHDLVFSVLALNSFDERGLLKVDFKINEKNLDIEPVFRATAHKSS